MSIDKEQLVKLSNKYIEEISEILNIPYSTIWYNLRKHGIKVKRKPKNQYCLFNNYTPESCYWAGFIAASGNILIGKKEYRISIKLHKLHIDHLMKFKETLKAKNKISITNNFAYIQIFSKNIFYNLYNNFNIRQNKSTLKPPNIPAEFNSHYIRGYFDGNGYINRTHCNIVGNKDIIYWISNILGLCNRSHYLDLSIESLKWLYSSSNKNIRLDKKYDQYLSIKDKRRSPGCKGFRLDYDKISKEYLNGEKLKPLAKKYNISHWTLLKNFKKMGIRKNIKRFQNFSVFNKYTEESCYWAGFLMADGFVNKYSIGCELSIVDRNHLEKLKSFLKSNATIREKKRICFDKITETCIIYFYSYKFSEILRKKFNIVKCKSLVCQPPNIPNSMIRHYIRGYFDGDGSLGWHKHNKLPRLNFCSGSKHMINFIYNNIINNVNVGHPNIKQRDESLYYFEFNGIQSLSILNWLYDGSKIYLDRKYKKYISYKDHIFTKKQKEYEDKNNQLTYFKSLYLSGMSIKDISIHTGKTYGYVQYYLKKSKTNLNKTKMSGLYGKKIKERDLNILEDYNSGMNALQLSVKYSLTKSTIWAALRRAN